jgi:hypothetical protein
MAARDGPGVLHHEGQQLPKDLISQSVHRVVRRAYPPRQVRVPRWPLGAHQLPSGDTSCG